MRIQDAFRCSDKAHKVLILWGGMSRAGNKLVLHVRGTIGTRVREKWLLDPTACHGVL